LIAVVWTVSIFWVLPYHGLNFPTSKLASSYFVPCHKKIVVYPRLRCTPI
jgi:hypothetical protein